MYEKRSSNLRFHFLKLVLNLLCVFINIQFGKASLKFSVENNEKICLNSECKNAANMIKENMNESVHPCDNFYDFVCGNFLNKTIIPDDKTSVDYFVKVNDQIQLQLKTIIEEEDQTNDLQYSKKVKNFYNSCMNEKLIEEKGLDPLRSILNYLGGWPVLMKDSWNEDNWNLEKLFDKLAKIGLSLDKLIDLNSEVDSNKSTNYVLKLDSPSLGLSKKNLIDGFNNSIVLEYFNYMVDIAVMLGADRTDAMIKLNESLSFEINLARNSLPQEERRNITRIYNPMTIEKLSEKFPYFPWLDYVNTFLAPINSVTKNETIIVVDQSYFTNLGNLIHETPKRVLVNYLMWQVVNTFAEYLNKDIKERKFNFTTIVNGQKKPDPRWIECISKVKENFPEATSAMYIKKHFSRNAKDEITKLVDNLISSFTSFLQITKWMDNKTKEIAIDKIKSVRKDLAYSDELLDNNKLEELYENLKISEYYLENIIILKTFLKNNKNKKLKKSVDVTEWDYNFLAPFVINAGYNDELNKITLPAGLLQEPFFNSQRPKYMNYGSIGFFIGHEISHGIDDRGKQYDKNGNVVNWWELETEEKYKNKTSCIINQYENYKDPDTNLYLNGINTQGENIADQAGIKIAYYAYLNWLKANGREEALLLGLNYTPQQMFWISTASVWCSKFTPEFLNEIITSDVHPPDRFRIIGPFSNSDEFANDFECPVGSRMNPKNKCKFW